MKSYQHFLLLLLLPFLLSAKSVDQRSLGALRFQANGQAFIADSTHARGYAVKQTTLAYINGASGDMVVGVEWKGVKGPGAYLINTSEGKAEFTINHKSYIPAAPGDYLKVTLTSVKQQGAFLLLNGTFEGQLQDRSGNKLKITAGTFETISL